MTGLASASIGAAREQFFEHGQIPAGNVPQSILRSWIRCAEHGLDAHRAPAIEPLSGSPLKDVLVRHDRLRSLARPELDALNAEARETGAVVILTNGDGLVLDTVGDAGFAGKAATVALLPGASWNEASAGTNGIGTALAERRAFSVHGGEHFFDAHGILSCATAPILDPRGVAVGALDISTPASLRPIYALGLVRLAVEQIERRLFDESTSGMTVVRLHGDPALIDSDRSGALVFDGGRLVGANRRGLVFVNRSWDSLDETLFEDLFDADINRLGVQGEVVSPEGTRLQVRVQRPGDRPNDAAALGGATLEEAELKAMHAALAEAGGNVSRAARRLGVHRSTLYRRVFGR